MKKTFLRFCLLLILSGLTSLQGAAQNVINTDSSNQHIDYVGRIREFGDFPKQARSVLRDFSVTGYYRFVTNYRHLDESYSHLASTPNTIFVGDDSQIPQLSLNISGSVSKKTSFGTDLYMWTPLTGAGQKENVKGLNLGVSLYGTYVNDAGEFTVRTGGINWYSLSPFTFQTNKGYDRYSIFERNPWDPATKNVDDRYATFYNSGAINQDERWGQQAFQGLILEAKKLANGFSGVLMYGKTQLNGGLSPLPNNSYGGKIKKEYGKNFISFNTFNNTSYYDSTQKEFSGFNIATIEFKQLLGKFTFKGEVGTGRTFIKDVYNDWGELFSVKALTEIASLVPVEIHVYRISDKVINNSGSFINTSNDLSANDVTSLGTQPVLPAVASAMVPVGQLTNNRQGIDLNGQINIGRVKTSIGYTTSAELENISSSITYSHPINSLALAHFWRWDFPSNVGPYNNLSKIYRSVYETVHITQTDASTLLPISKKYFNSLELNMKYKTSVFGKDCYLYYLGQYSSAQPEASAITVFNEKAYLRTYYHQFESYIKLTRSIVWCSYLGYERIIANYKTETDVVTKRPKNQTGIGIATGVDIRMSKNAGLYLRHRWMNYKDTSFQKDRYNGYESTVEIKIFF